MIAAGLIGEAGHLFMEMARLLRGAGPTTTKGTGAFAVVRITRRLSKTTAKAPVPFVVVFAIMDNVEFR